MITRCLWSPRRKWHPGGLTHFHRQFGCQDTGVGASANSVRAEVLTCHGGPSKQFSLSLHAQWRVAAALSPVHGISVRNPARPSRVGHVKPRKKQEGRTEMAFALIDLPYSSDALAPAISAETLSYHHGKHHKAYIDKTNAAIEGGELDGKPLEAVIAAARGSNQGLFNNAAQSWNHGFYWHSLTGSSAAPSGRPCRQDRRRLRQSRRSQDQAGRPRRGPLRQRLGLARREGRQAVDRGNP